MLTFSKRGSDSQLVDVVWKSRSMSDGTFLSVAATRLELVMSRQAGNIEIGFRGPETRPSPAAYAADIEWFGITFRPGVHLRPFPTTTLTDGHIALPGAAGRKFWLDAAAWPYPDFDTADVFVARLQRAGVISLDPVVADALANQPVAYTRRTLQRRFLHATGLTHGALAQIERARSAALALQQGASILDTVSAAGYADQPHLTRSLRRYIGLTPAQLMGSPAPVSLHFS